MLAWDRGSKGISGVTHHAKSCSYQSNLCYRMGTRTFKGQKYSGLFVFEFIERLSFAGINKDDLTRNCESLVELEVLKHNTTLREVVLFRLMPNLSSSWNLQHRVEYYTTLCGCGRKAAREPKLQLRDLQVFHVEFSGRPFTLTGRSKLKQ